MEGLTAGTLILTGYGLTPVETINEGDIIVRPDGTFTTVTRAGHMPSDTISLYGQGHTGFTCTPGILFTDMEDDTPRPACHMKDRRWTIGMPRMEDNPDTRLTDTEAWALGWLAGSGFTINDGFYLPASSQPDGETVERFRAANLTEHYPGCWGTEQDVNRIWDAYHPLNETGGDTTAEDTYTDVLPLMELPDNLRRELLNGYAHSPASVISHSNVWKSESRDREAAVVLCMLSARTGNTVSILPWKPTGSPPGRTRNASRTASASASTRRGTIMKPLIITLIILFVLIVLLLTYALMRASKRGDMLQEIIDAQHNLDQAEQKTDESK